MDTSKINKDAKTLVNIITKSEDVNLLIQEVNKILVKKKKNLALSLMDCDLNHEEETHG